ncbi:hypothetical protein EDD29_6972 [Actinocorallia herbida]|uniref:Ribosomal L7/L12-like protein n=1 Tax=Actinocorallia herbida TaxID=58109 RepID=A0A3N1D6Y4_9ACTN|nr:hypothetical protein [Actinocorallia herbida]ROO89284.1 hypothetical protein EDD29_6972 [Actinocorallia herbida]
MTDPWPSIDAEILQGHNIAAIAILREEFGYTIHEAVDALQERYDRLMETRPDDFSDAPPASGECVRS